MTFTLQHENVEVCDAVSVSVLRTLQNAHLLFLFFFTNLAASVTFQAKMKIISYLLDLCLKLWQREKK